MTKTKTYCVTDDFNNRLVDFSGGHLTPGQLDSLIEIFRKEICKYPYTDIIETNLIRILVAQYDRVSFLKESMNYQFHIEVLTAIAANSNYLTDILVRSPGYLYQIFNKEYLQKEIVKSEISKEISEGIDKFNSLDSKIRFLKNFKRRITLKIGLSDILGIFDFTTTTMSISVLASAISAALFSLCYHETLDKYHISKVEGKYVLAALGKLGGNELNYSSDIDLILFYDENNKFGIKKQIEYHLIVSEAAQLFIKSSNSNEGDGYLYRIDFRLRPDGQYSPICRKINDYLKYYEVRGENWERQMLIKLDYVGGSHELYLSFQNYLRPFIYPGSFLNSPLAQIREMKKLIEAGPDNKNNVKLFHGGIRDIEFSVQALQLLNGGKKPELQTGNTLKAIEILEQNNLLSFEEAAILRTAYIYYRKIEHYLQLMNDIQTHDLPAESHRKANLAKYLGIKSVSVFKKELDSHRKKVKSIYDSITDDGTSAVNLNPFFGEKINFDNRERAFKNYRYIKFGTGIFQQKQFDIRTNQQFENIEPALLKRLKRSPCSDRLLENFAKIIKNVRTPSIWYSEFKDQKFFSDFLTMCEYSQYCVDRLAVDKLCSELFLTRGVFAKDISTQNDKLNLSTILFALALQFTLKLITRVSLAKTINTVVEQRIQSLVNEANLPYTYFIGGLGSFGTAEMNFASDIDIIFVAEQIPAQSKIQNDFQNLFIKLREELKPFKLDVQLRPEGKSSPLVWDLKGYQKYLSARAEIWEFQSLIKLRFITGSVNAFIIFQKAVMSTILKIDKRLIRTKIDEMHLKIISDNLSSFTKKVDIKKAIGGLLHINFLLDKIILSNFDVTSKCIGKSGEWKIRFLHKRNLLGPFGDELLYGYIFLRDIETAIQNIYHIQNSQFTEADFTRHLIIKYVKHSKNNKFAINKISHVLQTNNKVIDNIMGAKS